MLFINNPLLLELNGKNNNILSMRSKITQRNQFRNYTAYSQASLMYFEFQGTSFSQGNENLQNSIVTQTGSSINENVREGRNYVFIAETPLSNNDTAKNYADWENNYRQTQGFQYREAAQGERDGGEERPIKGRVERGLGASCA